MNASPNKLAEQTRLKYWNRHKDKRPFYPNLHRYNSAKRISLAIQFIKGHRRQNNPDFRSLQFIWVPLFHLVLEGFTKEELVYAVEEAYRKRIKAYETTDKVVTEWNLSPEDYDPHYVMPYLEDKITELIREIEQGKDWKDLNKIPDEDLKKVQAILDEEIMKEWKSRK